LPTIKRKKTVAATDAIIVFPTCVLVKPRSSLTIAIKGDIPNQPKKQRKNANQDKWKARIWGVLRSSYLICVALFLMSMFEIP